MQYLVSKDNFTKITEPKGTLQNISRTLTIEVSNTQTENSGVLLPPMSKIQFDGNSVYVRCVDGAGAEARVIPFEVVVKGGDGGGTDFSLDQAGTTIVEDFKFSALEYPNATNPNLDGKTVLVMAVKDANETTQLVKYVFVDLAKLIGASTNLKPSDNAIGISGASIGLNLSASAGNILSVADDGLYAWLGVAGGVSGNFAILGESGAIIDGGFSLADLVVGGSSVFDTPVTFNEDATFNAPIKISSKKATLQLGAVSENSDWFSLKNPANSSTYLTMRPQVIELKASSQMFLTATSSLRIQADTITLASLNIRGLPEAAISSSGTVPGIMPAKDKVFLEQLRADGIGDLKIVTDAITRKQPTANQVLWLTADSSVTDDACGKTWGASGAVSTTTLPPFLAVFKNSVQFSDGFSLATTGVPLGGDDFAFDFWVTFDWDIYKEQQSSTPEFPIVTIEEETTPHVRNSVGKMLISADVFKIGGTPNFSIQCDIPTYYPTSGTGSAYESFNLSGNIGQSNTQKLVRNTPMHMEIDYQYSSNKFYFFFDGADVGNLQNFRYDAGQTYTITLGGTAFWGTISEFRLFNGICLHTEEFTPPTANDYRAEATSASLVAGIGEASFVLPMTKL